MRAERATEPLEPKRKCNKPRRGDRFGFCRPSGACYIGGWCPGVPLAFGSLHPWLTSAAAPRLGVHTTGDNATVQNHNCQVLRAMSKPFHATALDILKLRTDEPSDVTLACGRVVRVYNVAWGYDMGDPVAHITTNISPAPNPEHTADFFFANEVLRIVDPENGAIWFVMPDAG